MRKPKPINYEPLGIGNPTPITTNMAPKRAMKR